jgi:outer membrane protein
MKASAIRLSVLLLGALLCAPALKAENFWEVYELALERDAQLAAAEAAYLAAIEVKPQARAFLLPQLEFTASAARQSTDVDINGAPNTSGDPDPREMNLSLLQSVYRREFWVQLSQADSQIAQAKAELEAARQDLVIRTAEAYFRVLFAEDNLEFTRAEKEAIGRQLEQSQRRFEVGLIAITDVKESEARFDTAVAEQISAENLLDTTREALAVITGEYIESVAPLSEDAPLTLPEPADIDEWVKTALDENVDLIAARFATETSRQDITRARSTYLPYLDLFASGVKRKEDEGLFPERDTTDLTVGLQATLPLFLGGSRPSQVREARAGFQQSQDLLELARRQTIQGARESYLNVESQMSRVQALKRAVISNQTSAEATQAGFEVGTRTAVDVLLTLSAVFEAERNYSEARYTYVINGLRLKRAAGILTEDDVRAINVYME